MGDKKTFGWKIICLNEVYKFSSRYFSTGCIFYVLIIRNTIEKISFFNLIIELLNFIFNFKSKTNLVTLRKCVILIISNIIIKLV